MRGESPTAPEAVTLDASAEDNGLAAMELAPDAIAALREHKWPGNVRELFNVIQRCALGAEDLIITRENVLSHIRR